MLYANVSSTEEDSMDDNLGMPTVEVPEEVIEKLKKVSVTTIGGILGRNGIANTFLEGLVPRTSLQRFAGPAMTLHCLPTREDVAKAQQGRPSVHRASFSTIKKGQVLVMEGRGETGTGMLGDVYAASVVSRGGAAIIVDGSTRDAPAMEEVGIPIYTRGMHSGTVGQRHLMVALNVPIACCGVLVMPGDIIVGDPSGVVVIPQAMAEKVAEDAVETEYRDSFSRMKVLSGVHIDQAFPLSDALRAEYEEWRKTAPPL
jgi:regulator of RNase E activity RraA